MGKIVHIELQELRFYSYHGFYPEEQILGNEYSLTIKTSFKSGNLKDDELSNTVNYEVLYEIATSSMQKPRKLLETVAEEMVDLIKTRFPFLESVEVTICKINPLFGGDKAKATVRIIRSNNY